MHSQPSNSAQLVIHAIAKDDVSKIEEYVALGGANLNAKLWEDYTPLMMAIRGRARSIVEYILEHGGDVSRGRDGILPLSMAVLYGDVRIVELLLRSGARDPKAVAAAVRINKVDMLRALLHAGMPYSCEVVLWMAARFGHSRALRALLDDGAPAPANRAAALVNACLFGNIDSARVLLDAGTNPNLCGRGVVGSAPACTSGATTPLVAAAGDVEMAALLLKYGADVDVQDDEGRTPLYSMCRSHSDEEEELFAMLCTERALQLTTNAGDTPLMAAAGAGNVGLVKRLLDRGACVGAKTRKGEAVLHWACRSPTSMIDERAAQVPDLVRLLLSKGADANATDAHGHNALMSVVLSAQDEYVTGEESDVLVELFGVLLEATDANATDAKGDTVLHLLLRRPLTAELTLPMAEILLRDTRVRVNIVNNNKELPYRVAVDSDHPLRDLLRAKIDSHGKRVKAAKR